MIPSSSSLFSFCCSGDALHWWRELFLATADLAPPEPYRSGLDGDPSWTGAWNARYRPYLAQLKQEIARRLANASPLENAINTEERTA
jgi:hypothetical protein